MRSASCIGEGHDPDAIWWSNEREDRLACGRVCMRCPVLQECTAHAKAFPPERVFMAGRWWGAGATSRSLWGKATCSGKYGPHDLTVPRAINRRGRCRACALASSLASIARNANSKESQP